MAYLRDMERLCVVCVMCEEAIICQQAIVYPHIFVWFALCVCDKLLIKKLPRSLLIEESVRVRACVCVRTRVRACVRVSVKYITGSLIPH